MGTPHPPSEKELGKEQHAPTISTFVYDKYDNRHHDLFMRTWSKFIATGEAQPIDAEQLRRTYENNPSGASVLAVAELDGNWVGSASAIASTVIHSDGTCERSLQISDVMVDDAAQGKGIGWKLLVSLTSFLAESDELVYTFPNSRSIGLFLKQDYQELRRIPSVVGFIGIDAVLSLLSFSRSSVTRQISLRETCSIADQLLTVERSQACLKKDGAYIDWRYSMIRNEANYRFMVSETPSGEILALNVVCPYKFKGIPFMVVLDAISGKPHHKLRQSLAQTALSERYPFSLFHRDNHTPHSTPLVACGVPIYFDPRPYRLLTPPSDTHSAELFSNCRFTAGDGMGF